MNFTSSRSLTSSQSAGFDSAAHVAQAEALALSCDRQPGKLAAVLRAGVPATVSGGALLCPMLFHAPQVYATLINVQAGEVIRRLGPYATASAGRVACGEAAGAPLTWSRGEGQWKAEREGVAYRVPVDTEEDPSLSHR